jgi:hypothetical protein
MGQDELGIGYLVPGIQYWVSSTGYPVPGIQYRVSSIGYQVLGIRNKYWVLGIHIVILSLGHLLNEPFQKYYAAKLNEI